MHGKMQESGLIEIIPLICILTIWGQDTTSLHPEFPWGAQLGVAAVAESVAVGSPCLHPEFGLFLTLCLLLILNFGLSDVFS